MGIPHRRGAVQDGERVEDVGLLDVEEVEVVGGDGGAQAAGRRAPAVVHVDDEGHRAEGGLDLFRRTAARVGVRAVDLGEQRRHHRRSRRRLDDLQRGSRGHGNGGDRPAKVQRDGVAGPLALGLGRQGELDVAEVGFGPQIGVPDEAVEVEGRRGPGVGLGGDDLRHGERRARDRPRDRVRRLDGSALRQVDRDGEFRLVVEGQQLDRDVLGVEQASEANVSAPTASRKTHAPALVARIGRANAA